MNFITEQDVINLIQHSEVVMPQKEIKEALEKQKKEIIELLESEIQESVLTKKDVIDLIKKESEQNSQQRTSD